MIIWAPSPPVWLTLGFAQVNLPVIFVCAPAMTANPQSSAGSKITFRMTTSGEGGGNYRTSGRSRSILRTPSGGAQERLVAGDPICLDRTSNLIYGGSRDGDNY
jgi:hypothetical protein